MSRNPLCPFVLGALLLALPLAAQAPRALCELWLRDGRAIAADRLEGEPDGEWVVTHGGKQERVRADEVLSVLGTRTESTALPRAVLGGGDVVTGLLVGGDDNGDELWLQSPVLGRVRIAVDRLECFVAREGTDPAVLELPTGAQEALFFAAALGFDRQVGTLHRFGSDGIRFQGEGAAEARWVAVRDLVGLRLAGAIASEAPRRAELCTRAGDRAGLASYRFDGASLRGTVEGAAEVVVPLADLASLLRLDPDVVHASRLEPKTVVEAAAQGDSLWPMRRDRAATGSALVAGGRTVARGLGVHSRSRVVYAAPDGSAQFLVWVAFDDSAVQLPVRGAVDVLVQVGRREPVRFALQAGDAPKKVGPLPLAPGDEVSLEIDFGKGRDLGDRVDWLMPVFLPAPGRR